MKKDFRIQYPLWQIGILLVVIMMVFGMEGWISDLLTIVNVKNPESIEVVIQIFSAVIYIVLLINFRKGISAHNKRYPNRMLSFFQLKPFEYIEDDEGWIFITRGASQKVYEFFYWALPTSLLIHLVFDVPQYGVVINILVLAIMQFLIYYLEIRKYVQEDIESDGNELF